MSEKPMTVDEAAEFLGLSKSHIYKLTSSGRLRHYKPGGKTLYFLREDLLAYVKGGRVKTSDEIEREAVEAATR